MNATVGNAAEETVIAIVSLGTSSEKKSKLGGN
jgi:hypothetical protein